MLAIHIEKTKNNYIYIFKKKKVAEKVSSDMLTGSLKINLKILEQKATKQIHQLQIGKKNINAMVNLLCWEQNGWQKKNKKQTNLEIIITTRSYHKTAITISHKHLQQQYLSISVSVRIGKQNFKEK